VHGVTMLALGTRLYGEEWSGWDHNEKRNTHYETEFNQTGKLGRGTQGTMKPCGDGEEREDGGVGAARGASKMESVKIMVWNKSNIHKLEKGQASGVGRIGQNGSVLCGNNVAVQDNGQQQNNEEGAQWTHRTVQSRQ
jgi:hypothetical protein